MFACLVVMLITDTKLDMEFGYGKYQRSEKGLNFQPAENQLISLFRSVSSQSV